MKKHLALLLGIIAISAGETYATVGTHNMTINAGGVFNYFRATPNTAETTEAKKHSTLEYLGGGFDIELGYLYLNSGSFINAVDTRATFGMNFDKYHKIGGVKISESEGVGISFNSLYFQVGTTYAAGLQLGKGKLLVDVLGLNLGYVSHLLKQTVEGIKEPHTEKFGSAFLVGINLPLGTQYIFDNGLSIGFRHRLDFTLGTEPKRNMNTHELESGSPYGTGKGQQGNLAYNLTFSLGYVFGK